MDAVALTVSLHVLLGSIAVIAGAIALAVRKGAPTHVKVGRVFAIAMGASSGVGAILGIIRWEVLYITFHAGIIGMTLILSSWLAARNRSTKLSKTELGLSALNILNAIGLITLSIHAQSQPDAMFLGFHASNYMFIAAMTIAVFIGDIHYVFRKELAGKHRIARHLWRMCLGFFIAAGSAFTGPGAVVFPDALRNSGILSIPEMTIALLMVFWAVKTLFWPKKQIKGGAE